MGPKCGNHLGRGTCAADAEREEGRSLRSRNISIRKSVNPERTVNDVDVFGSRSTHV
jgi:hypothetical protein